MAALPYLTEGTVVKGFGRGSKELGIPTGKFCRFSLCNFLEVVGLCLRRA